MTERSSLVLPAAAVVGLVALRLVELRTLGHLLYSPELLELGSLAWHVDHGGPRHDGTLAGFIATYQYNHFDQGTLLVQGLHWVFSRALGGGGFGVHLVAVFFEALTVGAFTWLAVRLAGPFGLLGAAPLLLAPAFVVAWQLMPYGNHTDFLVLPIVLGGLWLTHASRPRWLLMGVLLAVGVILYRLNGACLVACFAASFFVRGDRARPLTATLLAAGVAVAVIAALFALWPAGSVGDAGIVPRLTADPTPGNQLAFLGAPRNLLAGWPWRLALVLWAAAGTWVGLRAEELRGFTVYAATLAAVALLGPLLFAPPRPEYLHTGLYGVFLLGLPGLASSEVVARRVAFVAAALMALSGLADARWLADPGTWPATSGFDGAALHFELGVVDPDADEIPHYLELLAQGRGSEHLGLATVSHQDPRCPLQPARLDVGPLRAADADRCPGWSPGLLGARVRALAAADWTPTAQQQRDFGVGAWIVCQRDLDCVRRALDGAPEELADSILVGARAEAARQGSR